MRHVSLFMHDVAASRLPFEIMRHPSGEALAANGMTRRLVIRNAQAGQLFTRPISVEKLLLTLAVDPTCDLSGARAEGKALKELLEQHTDSVELKELTGSEATVTAVLDAMASCDVLHYCGHAFFDGPARRGEWPDFSPVRKSSR